MRGGLQGAEDPPVGKEFETPLSTEDNSGVENSSTLVTTLIRWVSSIHLIYIECIMLGVRGGGIVGKCWMVWYEKKIISWN